MPPNKRYAQDTSAQLKLQFIQSMHEVQRVFVGWKRPLLSSTVDFLFQNQSQDLIDLRHIIIATPSARANSRLLEALVLRAHQQDLALLPPHVISTSALADLLAPPLLPSAHPTINALLWADCLRSAPSTVRETIIPISPSPDDWPRWLQLGQLIAHLDAEISAGMLSFDEVVARARDLDAFRGAERWRSLGRLRQCLEQRLKDLGLDDPHIRRRAAIDSKQVSLPPHVDKLVLVGAADLHAVTRSMIDLIRDRTTALIHAPPSMAARFDRFGCVLASEWSSGPAVDVNVTVVDGPAEQAACVAGWIHKQSAEYGLQDAVIGVPDTDIIPFLEETLEHLAVPTRNAAGMAMQRTAPAKLLGAVADYLEFNSFDSLAALARHPDVERMIDADGEQEDWRTLLDEYQQKHVAYGLGEGFLGNAGVAQSLALRREALDKLLGDLRGSSQPLSKWAEKIANLLVAFYGTEELDPERSEDRIVIGVTTALRAVLRGLHALPEEIVGLVSASIALRITLSAMEDGAIPAPSDREAVELLGWLELPFDDTPMLVVTGFNEGLVPKSHNADPFLPNALRGHLKLPDNHLRFARDAFYLSSMVSSRKHITLIAGRRTQTSDPLSPSRLSLCSDAQTVAKRILDFYQNRDNIAPPLVFGRIQGKKSIANFPIPAPLPLQKPVNSLSVTSFRDYLHCPYRFYLKHILKLKKLEDDAVELSALDFGNLAHTLLCDFATSDTAASKDFATIRKYMSQQLDMRARELYGHLAHPAVNVQVEQLRTRLDAFCRWQVEWTASGKTIVHAEVPFLDHQAYLVVDGSPFYLRGRIDRIDKDEATGKLYVFDYKVPAKAKSPEKDHRKAGQWINLQLPLYRHLLASISKETCVRLGYITIPRDAVVEAQLADWSDDELQQADEVAKDVIRAVRKQEFWPPSQQTSTYDEFEAICQHYRVDFNEREGLEGL